MKLLGRSPVQPGSATSTEQRQILWWFKVFCSNCFYTFYLLNLNSINKYLKTTNFKIKNRGICKMTQNFEFSLKCFTFLSDEVSISSSGSIFHFTVYYQAGITQWLQPLQRGGMIYLLAASYMNGKVKRRVHEQDRHYNIKRNVRKVPPPPSSSGIDSWNPVMLPFAVWPPPPHCQITFGHPRALVRLSLAFLSPSLSLPKHTFLSPALRHSPPRSVN